MAITKPNSVDIHTSSTPLPMKIYHMIYTTSRKNAELHRDTPSGPIDYFMESFLLTSKLALRSSGTPSTPATKSSPMVAFAKLSSFTGKHNGIGLGDFQHGAEGESVYEEFIRQKNVWQRSDYAFTAATGSNAQRRQYTWVKDMKGIVSTSYECLEEGGGVVARMYSGGALNWKNGGGIEIAESVEKGLEELLIVGALSIWAIEGVLGWSLVKPDRKKEEIELDVGHSHTN